MKLKFILIYFILQLLCIKISCRRVTNTSLITKGWQFLEKFGFYNFDGVFNLSLSYNPQVNINPVIIVVATNESNWYSVYLGNGSCVERYKKIQFFYVLTIGYTNSTYNKYENFTTTLTWANFKVPSMNELYTFIVFFDCSVTMPFNITTDINLTNSINHNPFRYHFSVDEFYLFETVIFFAFVYSGMLGVLIIYRQFLLKHKRFSFLFYFIFIVILMKYLIFLSQTCILLSYSLNGYSLNTFFMISELFNLYTVIIFMILMLLLAYGLTIVCGKLPIPLIYMITYFILMYFVAATVMFGIYISEMDNGLLTYIYNTNFGFVIIAIHLVLTVVFIVGCGFVCYKYKSRRNFYLFFNFIFMIWFISVPILALIANFQIPLYYRFSTVIIVRDCLDFMAHLSYIILTFPGLFPSIVMYTTPAHVVANIPFQEAMKNGDKDDNGMETNNNQFFDITEFQIS